MQKKKKGLQGQTWSHRIVQITLGSRVHRGDDAYLTCVVGENHQRSRRSKRVQHLYLGKNFVGRGTSAASIVDQHVTIALDELGVSLVGRKREEYDILVSGPAFEEALYSRSTKSHWVNDENHLPNWD